jgi:predicted aspartyl protease
VADGKVAGIPVHVIIDTGAEHSLGNAALHAALVQKALRHGAGSQRTIIGATAETTSGFAVTVPSVKIGEASLHNLSVTFGDLHVFRIWGLEDEPAILVGMDLIGTLQRFVIDYKRQEIYLQARKQARSTTVRKCGPGQCQTRIPVRGG